MYKKSKVIATIAAFALALAACGSETAEEEGTPADDTEATTAETVSNEAEAEKEAPTESDSEATSVDIELVEWAINSSQTEIKAGTIVFEVSNTGKGSHKFGIAKGDSYETLPQKANGAVDEDELGSDFLGDTEILKTGETTTLQVNLEPGNYVFMCNIESGPNSHTKAGQVLSVTVVE